MPHLAMVTIGAHGHVNPSLPVLGELVRRGHRVSVAVPAPFADAVASTGATPVHYHSTLPDETRGERWPAGGLEAVAMFLDEVHAWVPHVAILRRASLFVTHAGMGGCSEGPSGAADTVEASLAHP